MGRWTRVGAMGVVGAVVLAACAMVARDAMAREVAPLSRVNEAARAPGRDPATPSVRTVHFAPPPMGVAPERWTLSGPLNRLPRALFLMLAPTIDVASANPGADIERSACVTVAIRANAAYECGDLRIAYSMPAIRVFNKASAATMLYNSQHARPTPIVRAWVTSPANGFLPNTVTAKLRIGGSPTVVATNTWSAIGWAPGARRQVALSFDASNAAQYPTNLYTYSLEIVFDYGDRLESGTQTGELAIVNRSTSEFGRGWWVAGYEQLVRVNPNTILWVGGDGSTRKYVYGGEQPNGVGGIWGVWRARSLTGVDSLMDPHDGHARRYLARGAWTQFDATGRHEATVDALGRITQFMRPDNGCARLGYIQLALPAAQTDWKGWKFSYVPQDYANPCAGQASLNAVAASDSGSAGAFRWTWRANEANWGRFTHAAGGAMVTFTEANGRINSISHTRFTTTSFFYVPGGLLSSAHTPTGTPGDSVKQIFRAGELAALNSPDVEAEMYTAIYSPRWPAVQAFTKIWLGPWGNPLRIVDPVGRETSVLPDAVFPLLPFRVTHPSGHATFALYNANGKVSYSNAYAATPGGPTPEWYYRYTDAAHPDNLTSTTDPAGVTTTYTYATVPGANYPQLDTEQVGPDPAALVRFVYCIASNCLGLPASTISAQDGQIRRGVESYEYDALGNLSATQSAEGKRTEYDNDGIGRLVAVRTRLSSAPNVRWLVDSTIYDVLDRVTRTRRWATGDGTPAPQGGPAPQGAFPQSYTVLTRYLGTSNLPVFVGRFDDDTYGANTLSDSTEYDAIGRVTRRFAQGLTLPESLTYDPAGNVTLRVTPRGGRTTTTYDALNRPVTSITSAMAYDSLRIGTATQTAYDIALRPAFPRNNLGRNSRLIVDGDTATFTYDFGTGQIATANNRAAQVSRTYLPTGALQTETQRVRTVNGDDFAQHVYTTQYAYDVAGRRTTVSHPTQLAPGNKTEQWYYNPLTGRPDSVRDPMDSVVKFRFDPAGQLTRQLNPNNVARLYMYTLDGELQTDLLAPGNSWIGPPPMPLDPLPKSGQFDGYIRNVTYTYDARGKMLTMNNTMGLRESATFGYTPLGHLRSSQYSSRFYDYAGGVPSNATLTMNETIRIDALGNTTKRESATQNYNFGGSHYTDGRYNTSGPKIPEYTPNTGRVFRTTTPYAVDTVRYDASGNTYVQQHRDFTVPGGGLGGVTQGEQTERVMYYNAADQLVAVDARIGSAPGWSNYLHFLLTFDSYRYDALGRRVLSRSQRQCPTDNQGVSQAADFFVECNLGYVLRTVWDGSKELYEVRMPDQSQHWEKDGLVVGDTLGLRFNFAPSKIVDRDAYYGRVGYIYGGAIDKPIVVLRQDYGDRRVSEYFNQLPYRRFQPFALYPQWDQRGEPSLGTSADGGISRCEMDGTVKRCTYAIAWTQVWAPNGKQIDPLYKGWAGSLLQDKREPNGLLYRRNRYLDPASGRFTQPDPIGLNGGLNSYGYAAGDPVSFSDPFGLCPDDLGAAAALACALIEGTSMLLGSGAGFVGGGGGGLLVSAPTGGLSSPVTVPVGAFVGAGIGAGAGKAAGQAITGRLFSRGESAHIGRAITAVMGAAANTATNRRCVGDYLEDCKNDGDKGTKNSRGDFTWEELKTRVREYFKKPER
jgi:RHS repeat-associated protein